MDVPSKPSVYLETSFISRLTGRPSKIPSVQKEQWESRIWWEQGRNHFDLYISSLVWDEISHGNEELSLERREAVKEIRQLEINSEVEVWCRCLIDNFLLPEQAEEDALHIACAIVHRLDFLLTWNCRHIANPRILPRLADLVKRNKAALPEILTPHDLLKRLERED